MLIFWKKRLTVTRLRMRAARFVDSHFFFLLKVEWEENELATEAVSAYLFQVTRCVSLPTYRRCLQFCI